MNAIKASDNKSMNAIHNPGLAGVNPQNPLKLKYKINACTNDNGTMTVAFASKNFTGLSVVVIPLPNGYIKLNAIHATYKATLII